MSMIDEKQLQHVAFLARLGLAPEKLANAQHKMSDILTFVAQMDKLDTDGVEPMAHPLGEMQRTRDDQVTELDQHEAFQALAPKTALDLYLVPKVIE